MVNEPAACSAARWSCSSATTPSDPEPRVSDYESLITQDKVDLVFGPFSTRLVIPAAEVAEQNHMLFVEPAGAAAEVFEQGFRNLFYAAPAIASDHYDYLAEYILALPEGERPTTAAYAALDDPFAQGTAYGLKDQLEAAGIETVADEVYPPETTDFASIAAQDRRRRRRHRRRRHAVRGLRRTRPRLPGARLPAADGRLLDRPDAAEFAEAVGDAAEGIVSPVGWALEARRSTSNQEFVDKFREMYGADPHEDAANGYTVGQVVAAAVEAVGCAEPTEECQTQLARPHPRERVRRPSSDHSTFDDDGRPEAAHMIQQ